MIKRQYIFVLAPALLLMLGISEVSLADTFINNTQQDTLGSSVSGHLYDGYGTSNQGQYTQTTGTLTVEKNLYLGLSGAEAVPPATNPQGKYYLNAGNLNSSQAYIGYNHGVGKFYQQSGQLTTSRLDVGSGYAGVGTYDMSGGTININTLNISLGADSQGNFVMRNNSQINISTQLSIGGSLSKSGMFNQTGGTLNTPALYVGADNTVHFYYLYGGTLNTNSTTLRYQSWFTQNGGVHTVNGNLDLYKHNSTGSPLYRLRGGSLQVNGNIRELNQNSTQTSTIYVDGGTLTHTGSISGIDYFRIGNILSGSYTVNGTSFQVENLEIGGTTSSTGHLIISDATIPVEVSKKLTFNKNGQLTAAENAVIHMTGSAFENFMQNPARMNDFVNLSLIFEGGLEDLDPFEVGGRDLGAIEEGWDFNFAMDTLTLGGVDIGRLQLVDTYDNQLDWVGTEALYVDTLVLGAGSYLDLNGINLYYRTLVDNGATIDYNGGGLFQLPLASAIPEPATLILMGLAIAGLVRRTFRK
ncbi:MAG: PEP-CTERM sorting domain-containing protein [Candidatus Auribacterota bacterium]